MGIENLELFGNLSPIACYDLFAGEKVPRDRKKTIKMN